MLKFTQRLQGLHLGFRFKSLGPLQVSTTGGWCRAGAQKLLGVLITIGEAVAYVVSGMYGDIRTLGATNAILIIIQVQAPAIQCELI